VLQILTLVLRRTPVVGKVLVSVSENESQFDNRTWHGVSGRRASLRQRCMPCA